MQESRALQITVYYLRKQLQQLHSPRPTSGIHLGCFCLEAYSARPSRVPRSVLLHCLTPETHYVLSMYVCTSTGMYAYTVKLIKLREKIFSLH